MKKIYIRNLLLIVAVLFLMGALDLTIMQNEWNSALVALAATTFFGMWSMKYDESGDFLLTEE